MRWATHGGGPEQLTSVKKMIIVTKHAKNKKIKGTLRRYSFLFCLGPDSADKETSAWHEGGTDDDI